jgi:hypothetical protein
MSETDKKVAVKRMTMEELTQEYPNQKIVAGSLCWLEVEEKQAVKIACSTEGCNRERTVRTSDLHQVTRCEACTRKAQRDKARERRKAKKVEVKAAEAATVAS